MLSSSKSSGVGVVGFENCGVGGGAVGVLDGLMEIETSEKSVVDGVMNDDDREDVSVSSTCGVDGINLPQGSRVMDFASVTRFGSGVRSMWQMNSEAERQ
jgi:hypothetical protein